MAVGKYSPTVIAAYRKSQAWWQPADKNSFYDKDGYDSYGYDRNECDRAGNNELDYLISEEDGNDDWIYPLYEETLSKWTVGSDGFPAIIEQNKEQTSKVAQMDFAKYSPTVSAAYKNNKTWWKPVDKSDLYDKDGFNLYGYNRGEFDRAGNTELDYLISEEDENDGWVYPLYEKVLGKWTVGKDGYPSISEE